MRRSADSIVFRALSKNTGQFNYWTMAFITQASGDVITRFFAENNFDMATLGQWSGERMPESIIGVPGEMVFEGDVLFLHQHNNECDCQKNWSSYTDHPAGKVDGCSDKRDSWVEVTFLTGGFDPFPWAGEEGNADIESYALVGNIHQNPELLDKVLHE